MAQHRAQGRAARTHSTGQHRAQRTGHKRMVWAGMITLAALLCLAYAHGHSLRTQAQAECLPGVPAYATGHMHINPCATLDASQVQDRRP